MGGVQASDRIRHGRRGGVRPLATSYAPAGGAIAVARTRTGTLLCLTVNVRSATATVARLDPLWCHPMESAWVLIHVVMKVLTYGGGGIHGASRPWPRRIYKQSRFAGLAVGPPGSNPRVGLVATPSWVRTGRPP